MNVQSYPLTLRSTACPLCGCYKSSSMLVCAAHTLQDANANEGMIADNEAMMRLTAPYALPLNVATFGKLSQPQGHGRVMCFDDTSNVIPFRRRNASL